MPIEAIDKFKPKNNQSFALMDAQDIEMPDGKRLSEMEFGGGGGDFPDILEEETRTECQEVEEVLLEAKNFTFSYSDTYFINIADPLQEPNKVTDLLISEATLSAWNSHTGPVYVKWGNETFECAMKTVQGVRCVGNTGLIGGEPSDEPFLLGAFLDNLWFWLIGTADQTPNREVGISIPVKKDVEVQVDVLKEEHLPGKVGKTPKSVAIAFGETTGTIVEEYPTGKKITYSLEFDSSGNPTKIMDSDGNVTTMTWQ